MGEVMWQMRYASVQASVFVSMVMGVVSCSVVWGSGRSDFLDYRSQLVRLVTGGGCTRVPLLYVYFTLVVNAGGGGA